MAPGDWRNITRGTSKDLHNALRWRLKRKERKRERIRYKSWKYTTSGGITLDPFKANQDDSYYTRSWFTIFTINTPSSLLVRACPFQSGAGKQFSGSDRESYNMSWPSWPQKVLVARGLGQVDSGETPKLPVVSDKIESHSQIQFLLWTAMSLSRFTQRKPTADRGPRL